MTPSRGHLLWGVGALCVAILVPVEAVLLQVGRKVFTGGFLALHPLTDASSVALYFASALLVDAAWVAGIFLAAALLLRRVPLAPLPGALLAAALALGIPATFDFVRYEMQRILGDLIDWNVIWTIAGGRPEEVLAQGSAHLLPVAGLGLAIVLGLGLATWALGRLDPRRDQRFGPRSLRAGAGLLGGAVVLAWAVLAPLCGSDSNVCHGLRHKISTRVLLAPLARATDFDFDGHGLVSVPRDPAPFDAAIHPFALERPGNGVDENGLGGDLPADTPPWREQVRTDPRFETTPDVVLIFLETFRADLVDARLDGRRVTPNLARLAEAGGASRYAFVATPYTTMARAQLLGGRINPYPGQPTLIDDFAGNGYETAWFSAQDDTFGLSEEVLASERLDHFYDARSDPDQRASRFATSGSLALPWSFLNARIFDFLAERDAGRPLFLYVNYHDTHFPYHHAGLENLLGVEPVAREAIVPGVGEALWRTYANAAANVDVAIGQLVERLRASSPRPLVVIVTADHGEALFERGFLGHGSGLTSDQTRVPWVLSGIGGSWPEPLSNVDLRGLLQRNLSTAGPDARPRFVREPGRAMLQFVPKIHHPRLVALRRSDGALHLDLKTRAWAEETAAPPSPDGREPPGAPLVWQRGEPAPPALERLVHLWERAALDEATRPRWK